MPYTPAPGSVLALDMATVTGWAYACPATPRPSHGIYTLPAPGISIGSHFGAFTDALSDLLTTHQPERIVMEAAMMGGSGQAITIEAALGRTAIVHLLGYRYEIKVDKVASSTVRKAIHGRGNMKSEEAKPLALEWCRACGLFPASHDAAEAILTLGWALGAPWRRGLVAR